MFLTVLENVRGVQIGKFESTDEDSGNNAKLTYSISSGNDRGV